MVRRVPNFYRDEKSGVYRCKRCGRSVSVKPGNNYCPRCGENLMNPENLNYIEDGEQCPDCGDYNSYVVDKRFKEKNRNGCKKKKV